MMPRRNRNAQHRRWAKTTDVAEEVERVARTPRQMAADLVRRGLRGPEILDPSWAPRGEGS